ncbi:MAG TPA: hypothetical protein VLG28_12635 [Acidimicrobiia bacterium]|nr:hypothetical protein [Acidimicrobiia bacterium]
MLERLVVTRIVSTPEALDLLDLPAGGLMLRIAPDEALLLGVVGVSVDDPHAIVITDPGWCAVWVDAERATRFLNHECAWPRPSVRPAFAQGMVGHLPVKLWLEADRTLFVVPHVSAEDFGALLEASL